MIGMQAQKEREVARRAAIRRSGHNFITLKLNDTRKRRIAGVEIINAHAAEDENGAPIFRTEVVGGELVFTPDPEYGMDMICHMLDSPHNRDFLVSHHRMGWWEIECRNARDEAVALEIERKAKAQKTDIVIPEQEAIQSFTADQIRSKKAELQAQLAALEEQEKEAAPVDVDMNDVVDEVGTAEPNEEEAVLNSRIKTAKRKLAAAQTDKTKEKWTREIADCEAQLESITQGDLIIED